MNNVVAFRWKPGGDEQGLILDAGSLAELREGLEALRRDADVAGVDLHRDDGLQHPVHLGHNVNIGDRVRLDAKKILKLGVVPLDLPAQAGENNVPETLEYKAPEAG